MPSRLSPSPAQVRMARSGLRMTFLDLAVLAEVSTNTLVRFEAGEAVRPRTLAAIGAALEASGAQFVDEPGREGVFLTTSPTRDEA